MTTSSSSHNKIAIIGAGNMGLAIYNNLRTLLPPEKILLCDKNKSKLEQFPDAQTSTEPQKASLACSVVILAIKPSALEKLMGEIGDSLRGKLIVSVLAGVSLNNLKKVTGSDQIIRAMPSLPIQVGKGIIAWISSDGVEQKDKLFIRQIFSCMGTEIELFQEEKLDAITAISGCGPAYFFYLCEILAAKAKQLGFSAEEARKLAENTCIGSAALLESNIQSAEKWRHSVATKGGITEAALKYLQDHSFAEIFQEAVEQAKNKSKELSG